jgi:S-adenosyl-L-methionine hydrolase (adenosine-forming)
MQLLTLTTDFGTQNSMLASVKGKIYSFFSEAIITDVVHDIPQFNTQQAVYIFKQTYLHFPVGTVHFVLCNLYEKNNKQLLYVFENGHHIFCPDNGFITMLFDDKPIQLYRLNEALSVYNYLEVVEAYLHSFELIKNGGKTVLDNISIQDILVKRPNYATYSNNSIDAQVLHIDTFGNVILNVTNSYFYEVGKNRPFRISFMRDEEITTISENYFDVPESDVLCLFNTSGYLEIAVYKGNAAELFGFKQHQEKAFFYNHIKIIFE